MQDKILLGILVLTMVTIGVSSVYATGCPVNFVAEHVEEAQEALEKGDYELAQEQLDLAIEAVNVMNEESE